MFTYYKSYGIISIMAKKKTAEILEKSIVSSGFLNVYACTVKTNEHDTPITREVMERGHAVAILVYDPKRDEVLLTNELRIGLLASGEYPYSDALPAGMIDANETPLMAAIRELKEETGLTLQNPTVIHSGAYASAGGSTERIALVYGTVDMTKAGGTHGKAEEGEKIETVIISGQEFIDRAYSGKLKGMSSLTLAFWFANQRDKLICNKPAPSNEVPKPKK